MTSGFRWPALAGLSRLPGVTSTMKVSSPEGGAVHSNATICAPGLGESQELRGLAVSIPCQLASGGEMIFRRHVALACANGTVLRPVSSNVACVSIPHRTCQQNESN